MPPYDPIIPSSKRCSGCKKWKPVTEFCANRTKYDGLQAYCKFCKGKYQREYMRRVREEHGEAYNKSHRDWEHRIQEEACCHSITRIWYPGYRILKALQDAPITDV